MNKLNYLKAFGCGTLITILLTACSDKKDEPDSPALPTFNVGFKDVPSQFFASDAAGSNLYYGAENQITTGYIKKLSKDCYIQFPINYGLTFDDNFNSVWGYSFYQGGLVVSKYHDMTNDTYANQLSVYDSTSPSGGNFLVAYGASLITDPSKATLSDYADCGRIYITNEKGYSVNDLESGENYVSGKENYAYFKSVWINNTTYTYLTMKNGNPFAAALNSENKGWFKVQFIAFNENGKDARPIDYTEAYLANFDEKLAGGYTGIIDEWIKVDLSVLSKETSILVINFVGSDWGEYGLNTPKYCALDNFELSIPQD